MVLTNLRSYVVHFTLWRKMRRSSRHVGMQDATLTNSHPMQSAVTSHVSGLHILKNQWMLPTHLDDDTGAYTYDISSEAFLGMQLGGVHIRMDATNPPASPRCRFTRFQTETCDICLPSSALDPMQCIITPAGAIDAHAIQ